MRLPKLFVAGYPGEIGGADSECWHTIKLWRRFGLEVTAIPTWRPREKSFGRLERIGCATVRTSPAHLKDVAGLPGGIVVAFCNERFLKVAGRFRQLGCKIVWVNCMTWLFPAEPAICKNDGPFDAYVFQSDYQQGLLQPQLASLRVKPSQCHRIRGAMAIEEFPFDPLAHRPGTAFVIGRISRADPDKYAANTWSIYSQIPQPMRARVLGWDGRIEAKLGRAPAWAECLPQGAETARQFFASLHCMLQVNGGAAENSPRSGLEAMAAGVAVVAPNRWGWREMIRHGETGYLANELAYYAGRLAQDEEHRLEMVDRSKRHNVTRSTDLQVVRESALVSMLRHILGN